MLVNISESKVCVHSATVFIHVYFLQEIIFLFSLADREQPSDERHGGSGCGCGCHAENPSFVDSHCAECSSRSHHCENCCCYSRLHSSSCYSESSLTSNCECHLGALIEPETAAISATKQKSNKDSKVVQMKA